MSGVEKENGSCAGEGKGQMGRVQGFEPTRHFSLFFSLFFLFCFTLLFLNSNFQIQILVAICIQIWMYNLSMPL